MLIKKPFSFLSSLKQKNSFVSSVFTLTSGTAAAQLIIILSSPVITRLYSPSDMGILASFMAIAYMLGDIVTGTYNQAVILPENEADTKALVFLCIIVTITIGFLVSAVSFLFYSPLIHILNLQNLPRFWVYSLGFTVIMIGFDNTLNRLSVRRKNFKALSKTAISQQIGVNGVKIGSAFINAGTNGLLFGTIAGYLIRVSHLLFMERNFFFNKKDIPGINQIKAIAVRYKNFPLVMSWSALLNGASVQLPIVLFAGLFSSDLAGYYSLTARILNLPVLIIGQSVSNVFIERASGLRNDPEELKRITLELYKKLLLTGTVIMSFVFFYGDVLFPFVFGNNWHTAGVYAKWISIWLIFMFTSTPLESLYIVLENQKELFAFNLLMFTSRILLIFIVFYAGFSDIYLIAILSLFGALIYILFNFRILYTIKVSLLKAIKSVLEIVLPVFTIQYLVYLLVSALIL